VEQVYLYYQQVVNLSLLDSQLERMPKVNHLCNMWERFLAENLSLLDIQRMLKVHSPVM
jgi:hypothetical protein